MRSESGSEHQESNKNQSSPFKVGFRWPITDLQRVPAMQRGEQLLLAVAVILPLLC